MRLLIVAATAFEITPLEQYLEEHTYFKDKDVIITLLITGVGQSLTSYHLTKILQKETYDLVINTGIAGALNLDLKIGDVVHVATDRYADLGVEEADGRFTDVYEMELIEPNIFPFTNGVLENPQAESASFLPKAHGITVNKVHGTASSIAAIKEKYSADIETMEGAAFFHICLLEGTAFLAIRSISNYVEPRNRDNWNLGLAIDNLNTVLIELIQSIID